jgi:hypothetical protein
MWPLRQPSGNETLPLGEGFFMGGFIPTCHTQTYVEVAKLEAMMDIKQFLTVESLDQKASTAATMLRSYALTVNNHLFEEIADLLDELYGLAWVEHSEDSSSDTQRETVDQVIDVLSDLIVKVRSISAAGNPIPTAEQALEWAIDDVREIVD